MKVSVVELEPGEVILGRWRAEPVWPGGRMGRGGWLVLTNKTLRFYLGAGLFRSGQPSGAPLRVWRLQDIRHVISENQSLTIGYGDRIPLPGVVVDGERFRLGREISAPQVVEFIDRARRGSLRPAQ